MTAIIERKEFQSAKLILQSSELQLPRLLIRLCPSPSGSGEGRHTHLQERGWGSPNSDEGTDWKEDVIIVKQVLPTTPPHRLSMTMVQLGVSCSTSYSLYLAITTTFLQQQVVPQLFVPELFVPELFVPELIISKTFFAVTLSCSFAVSLHHAFFSPCFV